MPVDKEKIIAHLNKEWADKGCPMCRGRSWNVIPEIYETMESISQALKTGESRYMLEIPVVCETCGLVLHVSARIMGLIEPEPPRYPM